MLQYIRFVDHWQTINEWFSSNPVGIILSIIMFLVIFKGVPFAFDLIRGRIKEDNEQKQNTRKVVQATSETVTLIQDKLIDVDKKIENGNKILEKHGQHLAQINGNFSGHVNDTDIHTPQSKLVTKELFEMHTEYQRKSNDKMESTLSKVFDRLNAE